MSRGLGVVQRLLLDMLDAKAEFEPWERWVAAQEVAHRRSCGGDLIRHESEWDEETLCMRVWTHYECDRCGAETPVPAGALEAARRAIRTLARAGRVETAWLQDVPIGSGIYGSSSPRQLHARLPLSAEEAVRERDEGKHDFYDLMGWGSRTAMFKRMAGESDNG